MPISKKPRSKPAAKAKTSPKASAPAALPDRRAMESFLAAISGRRGDERFLGLAPDARLAAVQVLALPMPNPCLNQSTDWPPTGPLSVQFFTNHPCDRRSPGKENGNVT